MPSTLLSFADSVPVRAEWFRFSLVLKFLYAMFALAVVFLLQRDQSIALLFAVVGSVAFGLVITRYVLYLR